MRDSEAEDDLQALGLAPAWMAVHILRETMGRRWRGNCRCQDAQGERGGDDKVSVDLLKFEIPVRNSKGNVSEEVSSEEMAQIRTHRKGGTGWRAMRRIWKGFEEIRSQIRDAAMLLMLM